MSTYHVGQVIEHLPEVTVKVGFGWQLEGYLSVPTAATGVVPVFGARER